MRLTFLDLLKMFQPSRQQWFDLPLTGMVVSQLLFLLRLLTLVHHLLSFLLALLPCGTTWWSWQETTNPWMDWTPIASDQGWDCPRWFFFFCTMAIDNWALSTVTFEVWDEGISRQDTSFNKSRYLGNRAFAWMFRSLSWLPCSTIQLDLSCTVLPRFP